MSNLIECFLTPEGAFVVSLVFGACMATIIGGFDK